MSGGLESLAAGRYDFRMGRRLRGLLEAAGLSVSQELTLADQELAFVGPARPEVVEAWRHRFACMGALRGSCGEAFDRVRADFLACLVDPGHSCVATVRACVASHGRAAPEDRVRP